MQWQQGLQPQLQRLDNECSNLLKEFMTANDVAYKLTLKGKHSQSIQTWKDHFLSGMASTHPYFPLSQWCKLVEQGNINLNLLLPSILNPKMSAYAQVFGSFNDQRTPLPPSVMKVMAHVLPTDCRLFDPHAIKGFSVGVTMEHYRWFKIFIPSTGGVFIADTVIWFPHSSLKLPIPYKYELICSAIDYLLTTIQSSMKNNILPPEGTTYRMKSSIIDTYVILLPNLQCLPTFQGWKFNQSTPL